MFPAYHNNEQLGLLDQCFFSGIAANEELDKSLLNAMNIYPQHAMSIKVNIRFVFNLDLTKDQYETNGFTIRYMCQQNAAPFPVRANL